MDKQPLIVGIDLTNEYCQACYYNKRHERPESVMTGSDVMRYMVPTALCYDTGNRKWLIGEEAMLYAEKNAVVLYKDLLDNMLDREKCMVNGKSYSYDMLMAVYLGQFLELIQINSGLMTVENITVTMRKVDKDIKEIIEGVFAILEIEASRVKIISYAESFAYFVLNEDDSLWKDGALLFDFDSDGFYKKQLSFSGDLKRPLIYINERSYSMEFYVKDLASEMRRAALDERLTEIFNESQFKGSSCSVFFTGTGFSELWFEKTLNVISGCCRVFKGNNLYVKGACLYGFIRAFKGGKDYPIVCKGRTKAAISAVALKEGSTQEIELSKAACDWYDAGSVSEFLLIKDKKVKFTVTSLISREKTEIEIDVSKFPQRPEKTTRVEVEVKYINDAECDLIVRDKGFGSLFESGGLEESRRLNLEEYI